MPLIDHNLEPSESMRRWFGLSLSAVILLFAWFLSHIGGFMAGLVTATGIVLGGIYYLVPASQLKIIRAWQLLTFPLAFVISHFLLGTVFFGVVLPLGIVLRICGHDPLRLHHNQLDTNWQPRDTNSDVSRYFKQF